jgi:hypothetical protein
MVGPKDKQVVLRLPSALLEAVDGEGRSFSGEPPERALGHDHELEADESRVGLEAELEQDALQPRLEAERRPQRTPGAPAK